MELKKSQCLILHLGQGNARHRNTLAEEWLGSSPAVTMARGDNGLGVRGAQGQRTGSGKGLGDLCDRGINRDQQGALAARRANTILGCIRQTLASWSREVTMLLYSTFVWPHLEGCVQF